jgi:SAM-dependent methyltransferase
MTQNKQITEQTIAMPPIEFQVLVCGSEENAKFFETIGRWLVAVLDHEGMLKSGSDLLDVGCGCGRLPRYLLSYPIKSYTGFDRHGGMIEWCKREIRDPRFKFDFVDLKSVYTVWDDQKGALNAEDFAFPYPAQSFDSCLLASVFTHMPPNEVRHYLGELARVMRPGGQVLLSIFFSKNDIVETHDDGINVFHDPKEFAADLERSPFDVRRVGHGLTPGVGFEPITVIPDLQSGYAHNWHLLTKR